MAEEAKTEPVTVEGGAQATDVRVVSAYVLPGEGPDIEAVATSRGVCKSGVIPVGGKLTAAFSAYSSNWMKPANAKAAKVLENARSKQAKAAAE